jgi:UDP-perosamine 4-acetyltransferase
VSEAVYLIGGGGHGKVLLDALRTAGITVSGIADADPKRSGDRVLEVPVIGGDEAILAMDPGAVILVNGVGSVDRPVARRAVYDRFAARGFRFRDVIHATAVIGAAVELGEGVQIMAGCVVQPGTRIGRDTILNTRSSVDHDCRIGDHVHVAPGATLSGDVTVGDGVHVGTGANVVQGVRIGADSVIGAGSLVIADVPAGSRVAGVPAQAIA